MDTITSLPFVLLAAVLAGAGFIVLYNRLVALRNRVRNGWSQIDVQLQRRYELIPNLVETARAYLVHERETLQAVTEARNGAERCREAAAASQGQLGKLAAAEHGVVGALGQLNLVMEAYPELKADERMNRLHEDLASTENRVAFARQAYSDAVMRYNTGIEQFPAVIAARIMRFDPADLFEAASARHREAVTVSFA